MLSDRLCSCHGIRVAIRFSTEGCGLPIALSETSGVYAPTPDETVRTQPMRLCVAIQTDIGAPGCPKLKDGSTFPSGRGIGVTLCHPRHLL